VTNGTNNVGIGTATPTATLEVIGNLKTSDGIRARQYITVDKDGAYRVALNGMSDGYIVGRNDAAEGKFIISSNGNSYFNGGNVGIGTITPATQLDVQGTTRINNTGDGAVLLDLASERGWQFRQKGTGSGTNLELYNYSGLNKNFLITTDGNVGIGTASPDEKLSVKGTIHTEEVKVDLNVPAPDYVFEKDYNLLSLPELESYINQNKHLPEVPSAKEMEANGINLKEMNLILLKKVEELTLHLIEQNKINEEQRKINQKLLDEIEKLNKK
jgi:hypothetical protein